MSVIMRTVTEPDKIGWKRYIVNAIIGIVIIGILFVAFSMNELEELTAEGIDYCDVYGEAALNYSKQYPDLFKYGNMSTVSPDTLYTLDKYLNLSRDYFLCEAERHGG